MSATPIVSVTMPVYNSERFLSQAIQSILEQTFRDFELIIIDDGSTDSSWKICKSFQERDHRIKVFKQPENQGVAAASNHGLDLATGKYIARMDSDDISLPNRLEKQVTFLETHPDIGILGGRMRYMDEKGNLLNVLPLIRGDLNIHWFFMFESPFYNPTIMFRKSLVEQYDLRYNPSARYGEDYELWTRFLPVTRGENLTSVLVHYRLCSQSLTHRYHYRQGEHDVEISAFAVQTYLPELSATKEEILELQRAIKGFPSSAKYQRVQFIPIYFKIWETFSQKHKREDLNKLKRMVFAWATRMILYPPFQSGSLKVLLQFTKNDWRWPLYLINQIPYFVARRMH